MDYCIDGLQHIGLPTEKYPETCAFYAELGFTCVHTNISPAGQHVSFLKNGNLVLEVYEEQNCAFADGAIDHIALNCTDIEKAYAAAVASGKTVVSDGIMYLPFWENGEKYFIIQGPNHERVEFTQIL